MVATAQQIDFLLAGYRHPRTDKPLSGGEVKTYLDGTSTLSSLWTDNAKSGSADNPVILDAAGKAEVYGDNVYKFEIYDSNDTLIETLNGLTYRPKSSTIASLSLDYGCDLAAAVLAIGSTETTLIIDCDAIIAEGTTVTTPTTLSINTINGGSIDGVAGGGAETLVINGPLQAGLYQIFGDSLTVSGAPKVEYMAPEWFGVSASATASINSIAINKALAFGGSIRLTTPGVYLIDDTLLPIAASTFSILPGVVIKLEDNAAANTDLIFIDAQDNVTITGGGKLDGNRANQSNLGMIGIEVDDSDNTIVDGLEIVDTRDKLVHVRNASIGTVLRGIVGGTVQQGETGLRFDEGCDNGLIENNNISDCGTDGASQFGDGIYVGASYCRVTNNTVRGSNRIGIVLENSGTNNEVIGNTLIDNGGDATNPPAGIWAEQGGFSVITDNIIDQSNVVVTNYGISMVQDDIVCNDNLITGGSLTSIGIRGVGDRTIIDGNYVTGAINGITASKTGTQNNVIISNNIVKDADNGIRSFSNQQFLSIIGNHISDFKSSNAVGIELKTGGVTFLDSIISSNIINGPVTVGGFTRDAIQLSNLTRCVISGNVVRDAEDSGIVMSGSNVDNVISDNISTGCTTNWTATGTYVGGNNIGGGPEGSVILFADSDSTPSVLDYNNFQTIGTTSITNFDDGVVGQTITIRATNNITIVHGGSAIDLNGSVNFVMVSSNMLQLTMISPGIWSETGRSI